MKHFTLNGENIDLPDDPASVMTWQDRYYQLKREYELLKARYDKLSLEESWRTNPDRMGR